MDKSKENTRVADLMRLMDLDSNNDLETKIFIGIKNPAFINDIREGCTDLMMLHYAVAAGLIDWDDLEWIKEHINDEEQTDEDESGDGDGR